MCGIVGGWITQSIGKTNFQLALDRLTHRGPNDRGLECFVAKDGEVVLGHTRLSIIDLSEGGHQPMHSSCGRYSIVFNGEIYNYRELRLELKRLGVDFVSDSDTEVLLASWIVWGEACLKRLNGMFSFVIFDKFKQYMVCVRDAFGIKPLFYRYDENGFFFASELPALLALDVNPHQLNLQRAYAYLVGGCYDDHEETFFDCIKQLMPGHILTLDLEGELMCSNRRWWWPSIAERIDLSFAHASEKLRGMFLESVRLNLRSDVPLGAALSGGVDSSAVVCAMRHLEPNLPIHTFTYVARGSDVDEEHWADLVNAHVNAIPHKVLVCSDELAADLDDMIRTQGEPFGSTSIYAQYRVFKLAHEHGVTVTLDGQGADELLAGYSGYPGPRLHSYIDRCEFIAAVKFLRAWSQWPGRSMSYGTKALIGQLLPNSIRGLALRIVGRDPAPAWINVRYLRDRGVSFLPAEFTEITDDSSSRRLVSVLRNSIGGQGLNALLRHGDRNSMRWSVESRVPFLSTDLADFLLSLPENYLISNQGETKHVFRAAMRGIVPDVILDRKDKVGFATPEQTFFCQLGTKIFEWLDSADDIPFLNASKCRFEIDSILSGRRPFDFRVWRMINFCRWVQLSGVSP